MMKLVSKVNMEEVWKDITGYKGYQVSNLGRIRTYNKTTYTKMHGIRHWKDRILKERLGIKNKMLSVCLYKNGKGKSYLIHRLVAQEFLGLPEDKTMTVNHKDGNRFNNNVENLEWLSLKDNIRHGFDNNLYHTQKTIKLTNKRTNEIYVMNSMSKASLKANKNKGYISCCIKKGKFEDSNYKWELF